MDGGELVMGQNIFATILIIACLSGCGSDPDPYIPTGTDADTDADSDSDADADTDTDSDADADTDTDSDADADTDTDSDTDTDTDTDTDADADTDTDTDTDSDSDSDSDTECEGDFGYCCEESGNWYDSASDFCWQDPPIEVGERAGLSWLDAFDYCNDGTWGGYTDWVLPDIDELISLIRGCVDGTTTGDLSLSNCGVEDPGCTNSVCNDGVDCDACSADEGPGVEGCYWDTALSGTCLWTWSSSLRADDAGYAWAVKFNRGLAVCKPKNWNFNVRCVRRNL
jgi:hypothetical protein